VRSADSVAALFAAVGERWGRLDLLVNNAGIFGPGGAADELSAADWQLAVDTNLTGAFLCAHHAMAMMKARIPRRPDHQQWLDLGPRAAPGQRRLHRDQARHHRPDQVDLPRRSDYDIACGQIDIGNAATELTRQMGQGMRQADGSVRPEPTFDAGHVADAVLAMASLPLDANVEFLTIMATKMPYIGRG